MGAELLQLRGRSGIFRIVELVLSAVESRCRAGIREFRDRHRRTNRRQPGSGVSYRQVHEEGRAHELRRQSAGFELWKRGSAPLVYWLLSYLWAYWSTTCMKPLPARLRRKPSGFPQDVEIFVGVHIGENDICHVFLPPGVDECAFAAIRSHKLSTQFVIQNCCSAMKLPEAIVLPNPPASFRRTVTDGGFLQPTLFASA